jgi:outer membrane lipoprotein carrier protein
LTDNFGQLTDITFSELELNPQIDPGLFNFSPPEGLDVIIDEP